MEKMSAKNIEWAMSKYFISNTQNLIHISSDVDIGVSVCMCMCVCADSFLFACTNCSRETPENREMRNRNWKIVRKEMARWVYVCVCVFQWKKRQYFLNKYKLSTGKNFSKTIVQKVNIYVLSVVAHEKNSFENIYVCLYGRMPVCTI